MNKKCLIVFDANFEVKVIVTSRDKVESKENDSITLSLGNNANILEITLLSVLFVPERSKTFLVNKVKVLCEHILKTQVSFASRKFFCKRTLKVLSELLWKLELRARVESFLQLSIESSW